MSVVGGDWRRHAADKPERSGIDRVGRGDPWAINQSLQAGSPFQISQLAQAFHTAGRCTAEADHAFEDARKRFDAAWNHQNGDHPINDSDEVQRVTKSLGAQSLQLPKIGADLEGIAASWPRRKRPGPRRSPSWNVSCAGWTTSPVRSTMI